MTLLLLFVLLMLSCRCIQLFVVRHLNILMFIGAILILCLSLIWILLVVIF